MGIIDEIAASLRYLVVQQGDPQAGFANVRYGGCDRRNRLMRSRPGMGRFGPDGGNPISDPLGNELWTVVGSYVLRWTPQDEQVSQCIQYIG